MDHRIKENLQGRHGSYILPFLWLHGEPQERVKEEILAIKNSGIRQFCAESRPYEDFGKEAWWEDFGFILKTAKELDMQVWLLDDRKFPTGYANGYLEAPEKAHLRKKLIRERVSDVVGPVPKAKLYPGGFVEKDIEEIVQVVAYRHCDAEEGLDFSTAVDLTERLDNGLIYWDIPEGVWRICVTIRTDVSFAVGRRERFYYYIDMLERDSCHAMIEAVYEPHYQHFKEYFGNTFVGFFSDEPGFLNNYGSYANGLGQVYESYPWRADLPERIAESAGLPVEKVRLAMPAMWEDLGPITAAVRAHYMEVITKLFRENFSLQLGDWCREHGVQYIGHIIEDQDCHMHMAHGPGHFFLGTDGQDMAGIDIVLFQDVPGLADCVHRGKLYDNGAADAAFFHYTMPKLASSHSHIQPLKQGRAMCEIFGAFGWAEGLPYMKALADTMLISGINHFVPHAFTPKDEDPDCPPHFYNGGRNQQYPLFKDLMTYMERCAHILCGGQHRADVAVFYNAEGHWADGKNQSFRYICRELSQNLIDFDIIPNDILQDCPVKDGKLQVNGETYGALIVSESEILPENVLTNLRRLAEAGLPVLFTESLPQRSAEGRGEFDFAASFEAISTAQLAKTLRDRGLAHINAAGKGLKYLRFYHVNREKQDIYAFLNEDIHGSVDAVLELPNSGACLIYDPWENRCYRGEAKDGKLSVKLEKGNMLFVIFGGAIPEGTPTFRTEAERKPLDLRFDVFIKDEGEAEFRLLAENALPIDISAPDCLPQFSGEILYKARFVAQPDYTVLDLGFVGETAEVKLNGKAVGTRINAPYKFSLLPGLQSGENHLEVLVRSNPAHRRYNDDLTRFTHIPPTGILGPIALCRYEAE